MHTILVIDDEKPTLTMFQLFLNAYGYKVLLAEDGRTGLELLQHEKPPIVFTDLKMPEMDGFEVLRKIKKIAPQTEVVVITGHGDMDLAIQALNLEATDFINKPIKRAALESALGRIETRLKLHRQAMTVIDAKIENNVALISIHGSLSGETRDQLYRHWRDCQLKAPRGVVFCFDSHAAVNGPGIAVLVQVLSELEARRIPAAIAGLSNNFREIFDMVGVTRFARMFDAQADALTALGGPESPTSD